MVEESIEHGGDGRGVAQQLAPVLDGAVGSEDRARPLVAAHDDFEEVFGGMGRELPHAEIVDDEQWHRGQLAHVLLAPFVEGGVHQLFDQYVSFAVEHTMALLDRSEPDRLDEMALAGSGRPEEQDVLALADEASRGELEDELARDLRVEAEVEVMWSST